MITTDESFFNLEKYVEQENYQGYDPYDTLNSFFPFKFLGKWIPVFAIQLQKRNPINIRPLIGIKKGINPKAFGLFLQAYSLLYCKTQKKEYLEKADFFFNWLAINYSKGYSGKCWGYNFPWANAEKYMEPYIPSAVVTGFVAKGLFEYYKITEKKEVLDLMESACLFLDKDLEKVIDKSGLSISYTPIQKDICYNASLLAAEILAKTYSISKNEDYKNKAIKAVDFVIDKQHSDGRWNYSLDIKTMKEDNQIDFHQGYILESINEIKNVLNLKDEEWDHSLKNGLRFYIKEQFHSSGRSYWRLPKKYPVEIHNQSQGIITLFRLQNYNPDASIFAGKIADWTVNNMQAIDGHFYYQNFNTHKNKIPYMRWSQAWMFLALAVLFKSK